MHTRSTRAPQPGHAFPALAAVALATGLATWLDLAPAHAASPLRVHPQNRRVFTDESGRAVLLVGSHEGWELQDRAWDDARVFDFDGYLDLLARHGHNVIRMWVVEHTRTRGGSNAVVASPMPYLRSGPGLALDGQPRFDLDRFDPAYFDRLRARVAAAGERGIYVIVMLFQGVSIWDDSDHWFGHFLNRANNINSLDGDPNGDGRGFEAHTLAIPAITRLQEAYVRRVVDTVGDQDNVLYEIANEDREGAADWQVHLINHLESYQAGRPKQHLVGMTVRGRAGTNAELFASPADWISTSGNAYLREPPATDGSKVIVLDSDHFSPYSQNETYPWRAFLRGNHPIILDRLNDKSTGSPFEPIRRALGATRRWAERIDLAAMTPHNNLSSTGFCLANPGREYLAYIPSGRQLTVDLRAAAGPLEVVWFRQTTGEEIPGGTVQGGAQRQLQAPFPGGGAVHLRVPPPPDTSPCVRAPGTACLLAERFEFQVSFRTQAGASGPMVLIEFTPNTALGHFGNPNNIEIVGKVLNGCAINGHWWVFLGGVTDQQIDFAVRDTATGRTHTYRNPLFQKFLTDTETQAIACRAEDRAGAQGSPGRGAALVGR